MYDGVLSIDLGASYTKIAYRPACVPVRIGEHPTESMVWLPDDLALIPSLAIKSSNHASPWAFGWDAANLPFDRSMQVFQNWKADLFRPDNDKDSATAAIIAHKFFDWLRPKLKSAGIDVRECQTRVAMPAFKTFDENAVLLARCMDLSGWDDPTLILKVREPHANALGLFAGGENVVKRDAVGQIDPHYGRMFGADSAYIRAARGHALYGTHGNLLTVMVVDIGAFTTDLASLTFDFAAQADGLRAVQQESHALGVINQLDKPLFAVLADRHGFSWSDVSFNATERFKMNLYRGGSYPLPARVDGKPAVVDLGSPADADLVREAAMKFAEAAKEKIAAFVGNQIPARVFLTGGGSLIRPVADALTAYFADLGIPAGVVEQGNEVVGNGEWRPWQQSGEGLQRLATALGGASVVLQHAGAWQPGPLPVFSLPTVAALQASLTNCRCQGGNKDCCFCGGRGFY